MAENWWDSYKRTDEEENWWESYKRADEPAPSAGGGRGFVNPPRVFEAQPVRSAPPAPVEPTDYGQASTDMMGTPMSQAGPGLIQRVGAALRPAPTPSVMDGFVPPAPSDRERQVEIDRRLSYGAGPISPKVVRSADDLRNARQAGGDIVFRDQAYGATVNRVADAMDRGGQLSSGQVVENTNRKMIRDMVTDDKAAEFRSVGEWAVDSLSTVASGVVTLAQLPVNILSPGSDLADSLRQTQKELEAENSDVYKASRDSLRRRVESEEGFLGKYFSTVAELVSNPTLSVNEALKQIPMFLGVVGGARLVGSAAGAGVAVAGRVAPNVALADAIGGGAITAAARGAGSTVGGLGASMVMAGGDAAGNTYETLTKKTPLSEWQKNPDFQKLVFEGKSEEDAIEEIATAKARMAALITAPLGILGFMGAESAVVGRGVGRFAADALTPKGAAKLVAKENLTEQLEEGGTQAGSNLITSTVKRDQSLMEGVPEAMATAAVTSTPFGVIGAYSQYKAAQDQSVDPFTDYAARANLSTQNPDGTLIAPGQSARRPYDIGPSAPIRSGADGEINFTPQGSITAEAGLAPIVVPMGAGQQTGGVNGGLPDVLGGLAGGSGVAGGGDPLAGLGSPGRDAGLPGRGGADLQGTLVGDGGLALPGAGAGQPGPSLAAGRGERATDADLLARAGQASEGAPAKIWAGRAGDGYAQQQDAQQAFPRLQSRYPDLSWTMQQDADGKF